MNPQPAPMEKEPEGVPAMKTKKRVRFADNFGIANICVDEKENMEIDEIFVDCYTSPPLIEKSVYRNAPKSPGKAMKYKQLCGADHLASITTKMFIEGSTVDEEI